MPFHTSCADIAALLLVILDLIAMQFSVWDPLPRLVLFSTRLSWRGEKFGSVTFDKIKIDPGGRKDVPKPEFPGLKKVHGEGEEAWALKDKSGTSLLKLRFVLKQTQSPGF
jgi:hypothetical protein